MPFLLQQRIYLPLFDPGVVDAESFCHDISQKVTVEGFFAADPLASQCSCPTISWELM